MQQKRNEEDTVLQSNLNKRNASQKNHEKIQGNQKVTSHTKAKQPYKKFTPRQKWGEKKYTRVSQGNPKMGLFQRRNRREKKINGDFRERKKREVW